MSESKQMKETIKVLRNELQKMKTETVSSDKMRKSMDKLTRANASLKEHVVQMTKDQSQYESEIRMLKLKIDGFDAEKAELEEKILSMRTQMVKTEAPDTSHSAWSPSNSPPPDSVPRRR